MAAGAGCEHAAEAHEGKALGVMAQRQTVLLQLPFEIRAFDAGLDPCATTDRIYLQNLVQVLHVDTDRRPVGVANIGLHAATDTGAATERNECNVVFGGIAEQLLDIVFRPGKGNGIGRVGHFPHQHPGHIGVGLSVAMHQAVVGRCGNDIREMLGNRGQPGCR